MTVRKGEFEWDAAKAALNLARHGVPFESAGAFDFAQALDIAHTVKDEPRILSYAPIARRIHAMVWTPRGGYIRVISLRKANAREIARYEQTFHPSDA